MISPIVMDKRGVAALEFAIIMPVLLLMLGGFADFSLLFWTKGMLASSVADGAEYAFANGTNVSAAAIQSVVGKQLALPASAVTVTGPSCYCISGTPATAASQTCNQPCPGAAASGAYITISASYTYEALLPIYSGLTNPVLVETTMVRLK